MFSKHHLANVHLHQKHINNFNKLLMEIFRSQFSNFLCFSNRNRILRERHVYKFGWNCDKIYRFSFNRLKSRGTRIPLREFSNLTVSTSPFSILVTLVQNLYSQLKLMDAWQINSSPNLVLWICNLTSNIVFFLTHM